MTPLQNLTEHELEICERAWEAGVSEAVADAVELCERASLPPPTWLVGAIGFLVQRELKHSARRKWDLIHYARWDAVQELRDRKGEPGIPETWIDCYERVAEHFAGTVASGSAETIRSSYQRVNRELQTSRAARYYISCLRVGENFP